MPKTFSTKASDLVFLLCVTLAFVTHPAFGQNHAPNDSRGNYYRQAFDQGFRAGEADFRAGRPYNYQAALVATAGVAAISKDYRNAFKLGYQDGYAGHNRQSDWYYKNHRHNGDCKEGDKRGPDDWDCVDRHDNGRHTGWYKNQRHKNNHHEHGDHQEHDGEDD